MTAQKVIEVIGQLLAVVAAVTILAMACAAAWFLIAAAWGWVA